MNKVPQMSFCENLFIEEEVDMNKTDIIVTVKIRGQWQRSQEFLYGIKLVCD